MTVTSLCHAHWALSHFVCSRLTYNAAAICHESSCLVCMTVPGVFGHKHKEHAEPIDGIIIDISMSLFPQQCMQVAGQVRDLVAPLETVVMPTNRFTRRTGSARGTSLHMPGVIKALASDWSYKKLFAVRGAGGRREYRVVLLLDCSLSM